MTEFEQMVLDMRTAQKNFFRWHDQLDLRKSKELERRVDNYLKRNQETGGHGAAREAGDTE